MKYLYQILILAFSVFVCFSCKTIEYDLASISGSAEKPVFLGNGTVTFSDAISESENIIFYDSDMDEATSNLNDPYLHISFPICSLGSESSNYCVLDLYFSKEPQNRNNIESFYQDALKSLNTKTSNTYTLYYFIDETKAIGVGQAELTSVWSDQDNHQAQINAVLTLCKGNYSSFCELVTSPTTTTDKEGKPTRKIDRFIIK